MENFNLSNDHIRAQLTELAAKDAHIKTALDLVDFPAERVNEQSFAVFLRVIVGQQLSVKAATTIFGRVVDIVGERAEPGAFDCVTDEQLRAAGLSRPKVNYVRSLCQTLTDGTLDIKALPDQADEDAIASIIAVKGLGVWSAHIYLMFSLGRPDIWPVGDLAVRVGVGRIIGLEERPTEKEAQEIGERWRPYRSAVALLAWHYYSNAPF